ncbi:THUMP domain-containing class I SAM-dependent RNA methyltransferase [[Clostridium] colinum]|uniref:THUMP domain-containing class I SAM-dependent RNA methyltransferase n=1 Tax=[Clostridium] colinum TaxID=36835 RepID=UPI00202418FB|nr:class I SAM-dependent RNA methyltransferase [[Clostridium] colinum]
MINFIATTTFGLEAIVKREAQNLGFSNISVEDGIVNFTGEIKDIPKANIWFRSADRILIVMAKFKATTFEELFQGVKAVNWADFLPKDANFIVSGKSLKSTLSSVPACQKITEKAIVEKLKLTYKGIEYFSKSGNLYKIQVSLLKDTATITLDTSGTALHKRGYRENQLSAPLKETLANALIDLSYYKKERILIDPTCGSGTIAIEAAMRAKNIAPGLMRSFASENWEFIDKSYWKDAKKEAYSKIDVTYRPEIYASDIDEKAIQIAKGNAKIAGVDDCIRFEVKPLNKLNIKNIKYGICVCNPPYAERIGVLKEVEQLYKDMGKIFNSNKTFSTYVLTSHKGFENLYGRKADKKRKLFNGNVKVEYYQFFGEKPPKQNK